MGISNVTSVALGVVEQPHAARVAVAVMADDLLAGDGVTAHLRDVAGLSLLPPGRLREAAVVVVITDKITDHLLTRMLEVRGAAVNPAQCVVLVVDVVPTRFTSRVLASGVVSVLARARATPTAIAQVVIASAAGRSVLSPRMTRQLVDHCRTFEHLIREKHGIVAGGLTTREVDIVRLLAQGMSTAEIASHIPYSERTIKKIVQQLFSRMSFRNRAEAIAYAFRVGAV